MGSYPHFSSVGVRNEIVLRARDARALKSSAEAVRALLARLRADSAPC